MDTNNVNVATQIGDYSVHFVMRGKGIKEWFIMTGGYAIGSFTSKDKAVECAEQIATIIYGDDLVKLCIDNWEPRTVSQIATLNSVKHTIGQYMLEENE